MHLERWVIVKRPWKNDYQKSDFHGLCKTIMVLQVMIIVRILELLHEFLLSLCQK